MFGFGDKKKAIRDKAVAQITQNLSLQFHGYIKYGKLITLIKTDPYIAGYIHGKLTALIGYLHHVEGLAPEMFNQVSGFVLLNLFGESEAMLVSSALRKFDGNPPDDYLRGAQRGAQVVKYVAGIDDIRDDPNYSEALRIHRKTEQEVSGIFESEPGTDSMAAVVGLEQLWIGDLLARVAK